MATSNKSESSGKVKGDETKRSSKASLRGLSSGNKDGASGASSGRAGKPHSSVERAIFRNILLYSILRKNLLVLFLASLSAIFSAYMVLFFAQRTVPPRYVPITADNRIFPDTALTSHNTYVDTDIINFGVTAIQKVNTYDWYNWRTELQSAVGYFTPEEWKAFNDEFAAAGNLKAVTDQKLVVSLRPTGVPNITVQGVDQAYYTWQIDVPCSVVYHGFQDENAQNGVITIKIRRATLGESDSGLLVEYYNFAVNSVGTNGEATK